MCGLAGTGLAFDLISLIPIAGDVVGPVFWGGVMVYLWNKGYGLMNGRRLAASGISMVAELIPGIQELPAITAGILIVIFMLKAEEKTGISVRSVTGGKPTAALNYNGTRAAPPVITANDGGIRESAG